MKKVLITGGFGFIGSNLVEFLNKQGIIPYILETEAGLLNWRNVAGLNFKLVHSDLYDNLRDSHIVKEVDSIVHLGASVDTTESMSKELWENNYWRSYVLCHEAKRQNKNFIFASSAAVYGAEEKDFDNNRLDYKPLNAYAFTKSHLEKSLDMNFATALRFFNVYGKNEEHKGNMASVIHKALHKLAPYEKYGYTAGGLRRDYYVWRLFKSNRPDVADGEQKRDFIHVDDVCNIIWHFINNPKSGIYNVGTGKARSFNELAKIIYPSSEIEYVDMPHNIASSYQYFTQAQIGDLRYSGNYSEKFLTLEEGVAKTKADLGIT